MTNIKKTAGAFGAALGLKGILSLTSMTVIVLALVSYSAVVTINPTKQFTLGSSSTSWTVYVNEVDKNRYLPGSGTPAGSAKPADSGTNAFTVVTDADQVCAIQIQLTSQVNSTKFSKFQITVQKWSADSWVSETLYAAATGGTTKSYINGLTGGDSGYIHQAASSTVTYLVVVLYSYDLVDATSQVTVTFQYTPLPQASF
jgi:hypothetical protein